MTKKRRKLVGWISFGAIGVLAVGAGLIYYGVTRARENTGVKLNTTTATVIWSGQTNNETGGFIYKLNETITATLAKADNNAVYHWYGANNIGGKIYSSTSALTYNDVSSALNVDGQTTFVCQVVSDGKTYTSETVTITDLTGLTSDLSTIAQNSGDLNATHYYIYNPGEAFFAVNFPTYYYGSSALNNTFKNDGLHLAVKEYLAGQKSAWTTFLPATYNQTTGQYDVTSTFSADYISNAVGTSTSSFAQLLAIPMLLNSSNQVVAAGASVQSNLVNVGSLSFISSFVGGPVSADRANNQVYYGLEENYFANSSWGQDNSINLTYSISDKLGQLVSKTWTYSATSDANNVLSTQKVNVSGTVFVDLLFVATYKAFLTSNYPAGIENYVTSYTLI